MKFCSKCKMQKPLTEYHKNKNYKDGYSFVCKVCRSKNGKKYYENNKDKIRARHKKYYKKNTDKMLAQHKKYYQKYSKRPEVKDRRNKRQKQRLKTDVNFRLKVTLRSRLQQALKRNTKSASTLALLGCSVDHLKKHLEKQFQPGMTWNNKSKWHVDHIVPCNSFDLTDPYEQQQCFHYSNLQPLWKSENLSKGGKELYNRTWIGTKWIHSYRSALTTVRSVTSLS